MLQVDDINFGAPQLEQERRMRLAIGHIREDDGTVFRRRRAFAFLVVEAFTRRLLVLG